MVMDTERSNSPLLRRNQPVVISIEDLPWSIGHFSTVPIEIVAEIFFYLSEDDLISLSIICKQFRIVIEKLDKILASSGFHMEILLARKKLLRPLPDIPPEKNEFSELILKNLFFHRPGVILDDDDDFNWSSDESWDE